MRARPTTAMHADDSAFSVYAVPRPGVSLEVLEHAVDGVIAGLFSREADTVDLERAKTQLVASATYRRDNQYALASAYGQALVHRPDRRRCRTMAGSHPRRNGRTCSQGRDQGPQQERSRDRHFDGQRNETRMKLLASAAVALGLLRAANGPRHRCEDRYPLQKARKSGSSKITRVPMIAMSASLPAGSAYDPQGKEGLAAIAAALLDEGAGKMNSDAFHTALGNKAIQLSVSPSRDYP